MITFVKATVGILISVLVLLVATAFFVVFIATKSHPSVSGTYEVNGLRDSLSIYRNPSGIPHVIATSDEDVFFGIGYAHAQDRLWQMDMSRRYGQGRLSEIFGRETLEYDMFLRCLGVDDIARKLYRHISDDSRMALDAYARGVNAFLHDNSTALPFEFDALGYEPDEWRGEHSLIVGRMMAWELCLSFWSDAAFGEIAAQFGPELVESLLPDYPDDAPVVVETKRRSHRPATSAARRRTVPPPRELAASLRALFASGSAARAFAGTRGSSLGSNAWAVRKSRSGGKGAILANDPHLTLAIPPRWYQAHLSSPDINVVGLTVPGLPFVIAGRNNAVAWGITNMMVDDCDLYYEQIDPDNKRQYFVDATTPKAFRIKRDTILVKDSSAAIFDFRYTDRSAVISDVHLFRNPALLLKDSSADDASFYDRFAITFAWTGQEMSDEVLAMYRLQKAGNWQRFLRAVGIFTAPGLNFSYADTAGNVGVAPAGRIPLRKSGNPNIPGPARLADYRWQGMIEPDELPHLYNPDRGYVFSANNKTARNLPFHITSLWEPPSRAERIDFLLQQFDQYTAADAGIMQTDVVSPHACALTPRILDALEPHRPRFDSSERLAYRLLADWDCSMLFSDTAAAVFNVLLERMVYNTFADELGELLYKKYTFVTNIPMRKILELASRPRSPWFDDVRSPEVENLDSIILRSFREALTFLERSIGPADSHSWQWGALHSLTLEHPLGVVKPLDLLVNQGPFAIGGNHTTINNSEWRFFEAFKPVVGPSMRMIADMQDSVLRMILPGGNSGQPLSPHYGNQTQLWLTGGFLSVPVAAAPHPTFDDRLVLVPKAE